jgi:hypothetical protein
MGAWMELVNADGSDEWLEKCSAALEDVQRETLRRAAKKIRAASAHYAAFRSEDMQARADHGRRMADLIDPEVE